MFNRADLIIIAIFILFALIGYFRGFIKTFFSLFSFFISILIATKLYPFVSQFLIDKFNMNYRIKEWLAQKASLDITNNLFSPILDFFSSRCTDLLAMLLIFWIVRILLAILVRLLNGIANLPILNIVNRWGGLLIGAGEGILIVYVVLAILSIFNFAQLPGVIANDINASIIAKGLYNNNIVVSWGLNNFDKI